MERRQFHIKFDDINSDKDIVAEIMGNLARKYGLNDNTETSKVPHTIRSIVERKSESFGLIGPRIHGFGLGARVVEQAIIVDVIPHNSLNSQLVDICAELIGQLVVEFGDRFFEGDETNFIPTYPGQPK